MTKFNKTFFFNDNQVKKERNINTCKKNCINRWDDGAVKISKKIFYFGLRIPFFYKMGRFKEIENEYSRIN